MGVKRHQELTPLGAVVVSPDSIARSAADSSTRFVSVSRVAVARPFVREPITGSPLRYATTLPVTAEEDVAIRFAGVGLRHSQRENFMVRGLPCPER